MATVNGDFGWTSEATAIPATRGGGIDRSSRRHRLSTVRRQQGLSLRSASRQMGVDMKTLRDQEREDSDLRLSQLYEWQEILGVPLSDLLDDPGTDLSRPVAERAKMVRIMKTVKSIADTTNQIGVKRLTENLVNQLTDLMPELGEVGSWHTVGQRRSLNEYGRAAERVFIDETGISGGSYYD